MFRRNGQAHRAASRNQCPRIRSCDLVSDRTVVINVECIHLEQRWQQLTIGCTRKIQCNRIVQCLEQAAATARRHPPWNAHPREHGALAEQRRARQRCDCRRSRRTRQSADDFISAASQRDREGAHVC
jgi:hypothetical protein